MGKLRNQHKTAQPKPKPKQKWLPFVGVLGLTVLLWGQTPQPSPVPIYRRAALQDTLGGFKVSLELYQADGDPDETIRALFSHIRNTYLEIGVTEQSPGSEMRRLHEKARTIPFAVSDRLFTLLQQIQAFSKQSDGVVDFTAAPLYQIWGFDPGSISPMVPTQDKLIGALALVDYTQVELNEVSRSVYLKSPQVALTLQPVMPGILVQQAQDWLRKNKIAHAAVEIDYTGYYSAPPPGAKAWKVTIPHPLRPQDPFNYVYLKDQAISTLGPYQNYFNHQGIRYHNLLNPITGMPARDMLAVSVVSDNPLLARMLAQARFHLPAPRFKVLIQQFHPVYSFAIREQNGVLMPEEMRNQVESKPPQATPGQPIPAPQKLPTPPDQPIAPAF